ncbi:MAG: flavodoxin [Lachnospiraceae bacterium]|nr:flavodoxin [Lachnospiraceae bacterium]
MKTAIIYVSQTGFTKRYAEWIAEEVQGDCMTVSEAEKKDLSGYDAVVFGGWCFAGTIKKLDWFKKKAAQWTNKKKVVYAVGASPLENPELEEGLRKNFTDEEWTQISVFYCPGGICYEKMSGVSRTMMRMFVRMLAKKKSEKEQAMAEMLGKSYDLSERKYIAPIVECLKAE